MTHRNAIAISVTSAVLAGLAVLLLPRHSADERHLPAQEKLSAPVRDALRHRMARHGQQMTELVWSVVLLDYDGATRAADNIAGDASLARPLGQDATELNAQLPDRFFALQDLMRQQAQRLGAAARTRGADELSDAYAAVARTCVACHRIYLDSPSAARPLPAN